MNTNFLLYQMGKVGSRSVKSALLKVGQPVLNTHSTSEAKEFYLSHTNTVVITAVRDLLARTISAFFQNLHNKKNTYWYLGEKEDLPVLSIEKLISQFKLRSPRHMEEKIFPWFDHFAKTFEFDVFDTPFERQKGYQHYRLPTGSDLLLYRYENLAEFSEALGTYCGKTLHFEHKNCGNKKWYSSYYSAFKNEVSFTPIELDYYYNNPIMTHFYSHMEIEGMRARWSRNAEFSANASQAEYTGISEIIER